MSQSASVDMVTGATRGSALRTRSFWAIALVISSASLVLTGLTFHIQAIGIQAGLTVAKAVTIFIPVSFIAVPISFGSALLTEKIHVRIVVTLMSASQLVSYCELFRFLLTWESFCFTLKSKEYSTMAKPLAIVLGGGKGTRLFPLTMERAKPAVPFGGKYRLVDIPISICINSGIRKIYILTQFNSASLHNHLSNTYIFDVFSRGFVEILAAEQTYNDSTWYQGTADAVRKNLMHFRSQKPTHYIILSGDQLYRMNLKDVLKEHIESGAEITLTAKPVSREKATDLGIVTGNATGRATSFIEKPPIEQDISEMRFPKEILKDLPKPPVEDEYLASMGIYIFNASTLEELLNSAHTDFGKEIIPEAINKRHVNIYPFIHYWEDIGTIKAFYEANLNIASLSPEFNFYDEAMPIYTHRRHLPATKMNFCTVSQTLAAEGSIITNASLGNSIIGIRTIIETGANLNGVYCMGANYYEMPEEKKENIRQGIPNIGIGRGTLIKKAIIDINSRIGDGCRIGVDSIPREDGGYGTYWIQDGIIIIPKNGIIPDGTVI